MIFLREVRDSDLPAFREQSCDPAAQHMAAFVGDQHGDPVAFDAHWARIRADPAIVMRTVLVEEQVVGHVAAYGPPDEREVTYWIARAHWGRGIATAALAELLELDPARPVHARAAADNAASIRVLEKCGFVLMGRDRGFARARGGEIDEVLLTLD
ncbi:GNAT family N-acetyltransferase [Streptomyces sp. NPDC051555]|uniref:GNAT family N-acetyltransferase n=1 Tax=Streptomyces sp. NPDC051555 TaxID=3365657 RepID=UPI0037B217EC